MALVNPSTSKGLRLFSGIDSFRQHDDAWDSKLNNAYLHKNERLSATEFEEVLDALRYTIETVKTVSGTPINLNLSYLADVNISGIADSSILGYDLATGIWTPRTNTSSDEKVKASSSDSAGFLDTKVDNGGIQIYNNKLQLVNSGIPFSKLQNITDDTLLGSTVGGPIQQLTLTSANGITTTFSGSQLSINLPQALATNSSPTFNGLTLGTTLNGLFLPHLNTVSGVSITAAESGKGYSNRQATAEVELTLPNPTQGLLFIFAVRDTDGIKVRAPSGKVIQIGASASSAGGYAVSTTIGSSLILLGVDDTIYQAISSVGTWTTA